MSDVSRAGIASIDQCLEGSSFNFDHAGVDLIAIRRVAAPDGIGILPSDEGATGIPDIAIPSSRA